MRAAIKMSLDHGLDRRVALVVLASNLVMILLTILVPTAWIDPSL